MAGIDDKGPAKPAGIEPGDVIVKFDGKDVKEMRDLPKIVADTPVGKDRPNGGSFWKIGRDGPAPTL